MRTFLVVLLAVCVLACEAGQANTIVPVQTATVQPVVDGQRIVAGQCSVGTVSGTWNLRVLPNTVYSGMGYLYDGDTVCVLRSVGKWHEVLRFEDGSVGWVHQEALR